MRISGCLLRQMTSSWDSPTFASFAVFGLTCPPPPASENEGNARDSLSTTPSPPRDTAARLGTAPLTYARVCIEDARSTEADCGNEEDLDDGRGVQALQAGPVRQRRQFLRNSGRVEVAHGWIAEQSVSCSRQSRAGRRGARARYRRREDSGCGEEEGR